METKKILVVDDEQVILDSVKKIILKKRAEKEYVVDTAISATEALEQIQHRNYDLVITDIMMPELDGIDFLKYLKDNYPEIDVIMITGYPSIESTVKAIKLGAFDYIQKPFTIEELMGRIIKVEEYRKGKTISDSGEIIDVDMPFNRTQVEQATTKKFVDTTSRSDLQRMVSKTKFCDMGGRECRLYYNTGIMCKDECPITKKQLEKNN